MDATHEERVTNSVAGSAEPASETAKRADGSADASTEDAVESAEVERSRVLSIGVGRNYVGYRGGGRAIWVAAAISRRD